MAKAGLAFTPLRNRFLVPQLAPGERYFHATRSFCDCDSPLVKRHSREHNPGSLARKLAQLRRRGWSPTKMARWFAQRTEHAARTAHSDVHQGSSGTLSRPAWIAFLSEALASGHTAYVGLLIHMYSHSTSNEAFTMRRRARIALALLEAGEVECFCDDVLYEIHG